MNFIHYIILWILIAIAWALYSERRYNQGKRDCANELHDNLTQYAEQLKDTFVNMLHDTADKISEDLEAHEQAKQEEEERWGAKQ